MLIDLVDLNLTALFVSTLDIDSEDGMGSSGKSCYSS